MTEAAKRPTIVPVSNLDQFVYLLMAWHTEKVKALEHMMEIPDGSEMAVDNGSATVITGDYRTGFQAGIALALMELGNLPFVAEKDETPSNDDAPPVH